MKKPHFFLLFLLLFLLLSATAFAKSPASPDPTGPDHIPGQPLKLAAKSWLLYDNTSHQVLLEENGNQRIEPASMTKLMTAYLALAAIREHRISPDDRITPSAQAAHTEHGEPRMFLSGNKPVTVDELLNGLIVASASDAAHALAEAIAGNETAFAEQMNKQARQLQLADTHFVNASGQADPMQYSSAHDLALLTAALIRDFPESLPRFARRDIEYKGIKLYNRNRLLWSDSNVDGMMSSHSDDSGYSMVASTSRNNHRLIAVVLGAANDNLRNSESQRLMNYGYQDFELFNFYKPSETISRVRIWKGTESEVKIGLREGLTLTLPQGQRELLKASIETQQPLVAPISEGQQLGLLKLTLDGKPYMELPLVAVEPIALVNIFSRGIQSIRMMFIR